VAYPVSFNSANFVARQVSWRIADWSEGDRATNAHYRPLQTFPERFDELLTTIQGFGVDALDLWTSHLNPAWATHEHVEIATELLAGHGLRVASLAGPFGANHEEFERTCRLAVALGRPVLGGSTSAWTTDRDRVIDALERHDLRLAFENHPERAPGDMLALIGDAPARVGTTVDTGWWGTQGYDAARAIEALGARVLHVHLKDVREAGQHRTCRFGDGVVPIEGCVRALERIGYRGDVSVEHEPEDYDPSDEIRDNLRQLRAWQGQVAT
jgi:sugar phosphate isomerase/epimerase